MRLKKQNEPVMRLAMTDTIQHSTVALPIIAIFELVMIIRWFSIKRARITYVHLMYLGGYVSLFLVTVLFLSYIYWMKKDLGRRYIHIHLAQGFYAFFIIGWSLWITYVSAHYNHNFDYILYITTMTAVPVFTFMRLDLWLIVQVISSGLMYYLCYQYARASFSSFVINFSVFLITTFIGSHTLNSVRYSLYNKQVELEEARKKAEEANKAKTSFLFNMSHDIRTPMNAIIGYAKLIEMHADDKEKCSDYLKKLQSSGNFLLELINNVLEMARINSGKMMLDAKPCDINTLAEEINSVYGEQMRNKQVEFIQEIDVRNSYVWADRIKLDEILQNLISNAYKYTPEGGKVTATIKELPSEKDGWTVFQTTISDTGIGMTPEFIPTVFEEFSRETSTSQKNIQGTGLGMPIVKKLVDLMGGTITIESELNKGTTFVVTIPHRLAEAPEESMEIAEEADDSLFEGRRLLLAEDNDINMEIAREILTSFGFLVEHAADGNICLDMLEKAEDGYYDAILMDIQMPNLDGYGATRKIRELKNERKRNIPIFAMTANAFEEDRQNALDAGMNGHMSKPIEIEELQKILRSAFTG